MAEYSEVITVEIPMGRYEELLRKEIGFEYRKAELNEKNSKWLDTAERVIFGATGKVEEEPKVEF